MATLASEFIAQGKLLLLDISSEANSQQTIDYFIRLLSDYSLTEIERKEANEYFQVAKTIQKCFHLVNADHFLKLNKYELAIQLYEKILENINSNEDLIKIQAEHNLSCCLYQLGKFTDANISFQAAKHSLLLVNHLKDETSIILKKDIQENIQILDNLNMTIRSPVLKTNTIPMKSEDLNIQKNESKATEDVKYSYNQLKGKGPYPEGIESSCREKYLSIQEFQDIFKMRINQFEILPKWKQIEIKKRLFLF